MLNGKPRERLTMSRNSSDMGESCCSFGFCPNYNFFGHQKDGPVPASVLTEMSIECRLCEVDIDSEN